MGHIFLSGQNQCHITGVKKSYFSQMDKINGFADQGPWKESSQIRASQICCVAVICYRSNINKQNK